MIYPRNVNKIVWWCVASFLLFGVFGQKISWAVFSADDVKVLAAKDIVVLADDKLLEAYIDVLAELEASKAFHTTSGFTPKEYKQYKDIVKYRLELLFEIHRRKISIPTINNQE